MAEKPIIVGRILRAHGTRGELKVELLSDFPERLSPGSTLMVGEDKLTVESTRGADPVKIIKFSGVDSRQSAEKLTGKYLSILFSERKSLDQDEFYEFELVGLKVFAEDEEVGVVKDLKKGAAQDLLIVDTKKDKEMMIPFVKAIVKKVDLKHNRIDVEKIEGLIEA